MATRKPRVQLTFSPEDVDPDVPRLYVRRDGETWVVRSDAGVLLSTYPTREEALTDARERARETNAEVFFESHSGLYLHQVARSPAELHFLEVWQNIYDDHHELPHQAAD